MNELRSEPYPLIQAASGCPVALCIVGRVYERSNAMNLFREGEVAPRQHSRNEAFASLSPSPGAPVLGRGQSFHLMLERNEQTIAHSRRTLPGHSRARDASK